MAGDKRKRRKKGRATYAPDNPAQSRKLKEAAKKRGVDEDGKAARQAMDALRKAKP